MAQESTFESLRRDVLKAIEENNRKGCGSFNFQFVDYTDDELDEHCDAITAELAAIGWSLKYIVGSPFDDPAGDPAGYELTPVR